MSTLTKGTAKYRDVLLEGPERRIVARLEAYHSSAGAPRERVRMECGHERAWEAGAEMARCHPCRSVAMMERYEKLIQRLSWRFSYLLPASSCYTREDLEQEGKEMLLQVLTKFDHTRGTAFITYLQTCVVNRYRRIVKAERGRVMGLCDGDAAEPLEYVQDVPTQEARLMVEHILNAREQEGRIRSTKAPGCFATGLYVPDAVCGACAASPECRLAPKRGTLAEQERTRESLWARSVERRCAAL